MDIQAKNSGYMGGQNYALHSTAKPSPAALEFQTFLDDIEGLISEATTMTGEELDRAKNTLFARIDTIKDSFNDISGGLSYKARKSVAMTNHYVHEQPWSAIGASTLVGVFIGFLLTRRH